MTAAVDREAAKFSMLWFSLARAAWAAEVAVVVAVLPVVLDMVVGAGVGVPEAAGVVGL